MEQRTNAQLHLYTLNPRFTNEYLEDNIPNEPEPPHHLPVHKQMA